MWDYIKFKIGEAELPNGADYTGLVLEYFLWIIGAFLILSLVAVFFVTVAWKLFEKLGYPGFVGIIPFVNMYFLYKSLKMRLLYFPTLFLVAASIVFATVSLSPFEDLSYLAFPILPMALALILIALKFSFSLSKLLGRGWGTAILILLFPVVMLPVVALNKSFEITKKHIKCE